MRFNQKHKLRYIILASIALLSLMGCSQKESNINTNSELCNGKVEISLEDAIEIGQTEANKYYADMCLTEVHSYDGDDEPNMDTGSDGKREWWYVNFGNENLNFVSILIKGNEVVAVEKFDNCQHYGLIDLSKLQMSSEGAAQKAMEQGLRGGNPDNPDEWVRGYNFKVSYGSLVQEPENIRLFMEVIGISTNGNFAHILFDAETEDVLLLEEKIEYTDGTVEWKPLTPDSSDSTIYDAFLSTVGEDQSYAVVETNAAEPLLLLTTATYDDGNGNQAAIFADVYFTKNGETEMLGTVTGEGTAYPLAYDEKGIYAASGHQVEKYALDEEGSFRFAEGVYETFDENGVATYTKKVGEHSEVIDEEQYLAFRGNYDNAKVVNFAKNEK